MFQSLVVSSSKCWCRSEVQRHNRSNELHARILVQNLLVEGGDTDS